MAYIVTLDHGSKWCSEKDSNLHRPGRNRLSCPLEMIRTEILLLFME